MNHRWNPLRKHARHAIRYIRAHAGQSFFSGLGIGFSLCLLALTNASRRGTHRSMLQEFEGLGHNSALIYVHEDRPIPRRFFQGLNQLCQNRDWSFLPVFESPSWINASDLPRHSRVLFTVESFLRLFQPVLVSGRSPNGNDAHLERLMIGETLARKLGFRFEDPYIKVDGAWHQVTGVVASFGAGGSQVHQFLDIGDAALIVREIDAPVLGKKQLKFALIRTASRGDVLTLAEIFPQFLKDQKLNHLKLSLQLPIKQQELTAKSEHLLVSHGVLVSVVCLFLSGLGILISYHLQLTYRREEFGTLVALGASKNYIGMNLFMEVVILAGASGLVGLVVGVFFSWIWGALGDMAVYIHPLDLLQSLAVLGAVAVTTALAPAFWALRLDPIQLLRLYR